MPRKWGIFGVELPLVCTARENRVEPDGAKGTVLITGAAGTVGSVAARSLGQDYRLVSLDLRIPGESDLYHETYVGNLNDRELVMAAVSGADYVLHLAGGVASGWGGLLDAEIEGTRNVLDAAMTHQASRVVLASSNHIAGWHELDQLKSGSTASYDLRAPIRPDGLYGASKAFVEALGRSAAEYAGLPVSVLRIGTMRLHDSPARLAGDVSFSYLGDHQEVEERMRRTWLYHRDFKRILLEEFGARETFRLRFAVSGEDSPWTTDVQSWSR